ncbi:hypothetical protein [Hydrogenophaga sp.]|uniref:hypothetical protein n=1 Tax=Hydrogenophaga sp. TaxID=1904254 RepID=UPI0027260E30|nr:hypothetical protein [Hydrogenophaga sp.]MDO8905964.1 hypothetical protein [Hydrogenophaga sp.]
MKKTAASPNALAPAPTGLESEAIEPAAPQRTRGQLAADKAISTAKTAVTLAKAHLIRESRKHGGRWQWVDFPGAKGRESAGIVDILAVRKRWEISGLPEDEVLKHLDVFDIMLIQVKGGGARMPSAIDIARMERVADLYNIDKVLLYQWNTNRKSETGYRVLDRTTHTFGPVVTDNKALFG